jgi:hypothetical protein
MWSPPANLLRLHAVEEKCRAEAFALIGRDVDLQKQLLLVERAMDALIVTARRSTDSEDEATVQLLALRLLNDCSAALKLLLGGYAQASAMALRDILETGYLVAYLTADPSRIPLWRKADQKSLETDFASAVIRQALDKPNGFRDGQRAARYAVLCKLAIHPTFESFRLLTPEGQRCHGGPFTDQRVFSGLLKEMALIVCAAVPVVLAFFPEKKRQVH